MSHPTLAHDLALKRTVHTPVEQKPHYAWRDVIAGETIEVPPVVLLCPHGEERFVLAEVADTLGKALTNVHLAKGRRTSSTTPTAPGWPGSAAKWRPTSRPSPASNRRSGSP